MGGLALVACALVVAPWTIRNQAALGAFVPVSTNMWTVIGGANCHEAYFGERTGWWVFRCFERGLEQGDSEIEIYSGQRDAALEFAADNTREVPRVVGTRLVRVWGLYDPVRQSTYEATEGRNLGWHRAGHALAWLLLPLAVAGGVVSRRRGVRLWPLVATAAVASAVAMVTYGNQRFRLQADLAVVVLASVAVVRGAELARSRRG
jgi:hypothetical protein